MSKAYVSNMTTNATKPYTYRFLMGVLILVAVSLLLDIAIYGIFSNGAQAFWTKPVLGALVLVEAFIIYVFCKVNRS